MNGYSGNQMYGGSVVSSIGNFIGSLITKGDVAFILLIFMLGMIVKNTFIYDIEIFSLIGLVYLYSRVAADVVCQLDDDA